MMSHSGENQADVVFQPGVRRINYWRDQTVVSPWSSRAATAGNLRFVDSEQRAGTRARHAAGVRCLTVTLSSQPEALIYDATLQLAISFV